MYHKNIYFSSFFLSLEEKKLKFNAIVLFFSALVVLLFSGSATGVQIDISDVPLDSQLSAAAPNLMFGLDDSGSMDWEILTAETEGLFNIGNTDYTYVFDNPGDNLYTSGTYSNIITGDNRRYWKSQWSDYNVMYYNPAIEYKPWQGFPNANVSKPRSHPYYNSTAPSGNRLNGVVRPKPYSSDIPPSNFLDLSATYLSMGNSIIVDNLDGAPAYTKTGTWAESGYTPEYANSSEYTGSNGTATFTPNITIARNYAVHAWWNCYNDRDTNAKLTITHSGGTTVLYKNQQSTTGICGQWVPLGSYYFAAGRSGNIKIERHAGSTNGSTVADAVRLSDMSVANAHYYTWYDANNNTVIDTGEIYLINLNGAISYFQFNDNDNDNKVDSGELLPIVTPPAEVESKRTYAQEIQNFANWYSFYRKRRAMAVATISDVIPKLKGVNVGFRSINGHIISRVLPVNVGGVDSTNTLLDLLFSYHQGTHTTGSTPLRLGLENIGKYYDTIQAISPAEPELAVSPIEIGAKGECQQNFTIMFTDGAYNGNSPGLGNVDAAEVAPYADRASNTLADVAMFYWKRDLAPTVGNHVPTNFFDSATWQHMVTYTVAFGVKGNLDPDDFDLYNIDPTKRVYPTWPSPINSDYERIDDLWHTAVNGRGKYLNAQSPQELVKAFEKVINDVLSRIGSGASVSINGDELHAGSVVYQSRYVTDGWTGDVLAYNLDPTTGEVIQIPLKWSASQLLDNAQALNPDYWNTGRIIATYDGTAGKPFRHASLSAGQQALLDANMVNYLRGDHSLEEKNGGGYRNRMLMENGVFVRDTMLGDIVHSSPLYHNGTIFVGANDGLLHAFDADNGKELFAYVPNLVFTNLPLLTQPSYSHKFYVDLTPFAQDVGTVNLLVGGLGKGGKGYYCLDVTDLNTADTDPLSMTTEAQLAAKVKWEFPNTATLAADTADMGYSFSRAVIVKSKVGWVVIFGNGYNSTNESSVLFVLDALTGTLLRKIDTGFNPSNGLSTPAPVDVNGDSIVDYIYAGDLQGNMWKFDLTDSAPASWEVAYNPKPLFRAMDGAVTPNYQPITIKPDVMTHCSETGYIVAFGTGKYLGSTDLADTKTQTLYGIWDYGDDADNNEYVGSFQRASTSQLSNPSHPGTTLLEQTVVFQGGVGTNTLRVVSDETPSWDTVADGTSGQNPDPSKNVGWYLDLPTSKERVVRDLLIRGGKVITTSSIPQTNSPCVAGGESWLMELNACTGGRMSTPQIDINQDGLISDLDLLSITDGAGNNMTVAPTGIWFATTIYTPAILNVPGGIEIKYFSTAAGNIIIVREQGQATGMIYWRKL